MTSPSAVDLFCGAGGLTRGLEQGGLDVRLGLDSAPSALRSYEANFRHGALNADTRDLDAGTILSQADLESVDVLAGGPPCQGFSIQRVGPDQDPRNNLILDFFRLVRELRPRVFIMENVPGLLGSRGNALLHEGIPYAEECGFIVDVLLVDALAFGTPQRRSRALILGRLPDTKPLDLRAPEHPYPRTVWEAIGDLPEPPESPDAYRQDQLHRRSRLSPLNLERMRHIPPGGGFEDLPEHLRAACHRAGAERIGHRQVYGRLDPASPSVTITARFDSFTRGRFAHPYQHRNITLREGARLQGFPDAHTFLGNREEVAAQIGNAVPPPMAYAIGLAVTRSLA